MSASKGFSRIDIDTNESDPSYSLTGQLMGLLLKSSLGSFTASTSLSAVVGAAYGRPLARQGVPQRRGSLG